MEEQDRKYRMTTRRTVGNPFAQVAERLIGAFRGYHE